MIDRTVIFLFCSFSLVLSLSQQAQQCDDFVGSIGVNIHISYDTCLYGANYTRFKEWLLDSGIRRFRDGMIYGDEDYYATFEDLGDAGLKGQFIVAPTVPLDILRTYPELVGTAFERYEGPNEYDISHGSDPDWIGTLQNWTKVLWMNHNASFEVVAPSLTQEPSYPAVGNLEDYLDYGNMHNYHGTFMPETKGWGGTDKYGTYGATTWNINLCRNVSEMKPIMTTESGYLVMDNINGPIGKGPYAHDYVPDDVQAKYNVRLLFQQFGVLNLPFTYLYEFADCGWGNDILWGILGVKNNTDTEVFPRPSYLLIRHLTQFFSDIGASFTPDSLDWSMTGDTSNILATLFQRSNGTFYLTLWIADQPWNPNASGTQPWNRGNYTIVPDQQVTVFINSSVAAMSQYVLDAIDGSMSSSSLAIDVTNGVTTAQLSITDTPTIFSIDLDAIDFKGNDQKFSILLN